MDYGSKQNKYIFIKVSTKTPLSTTKSMKMYIKDDAHIGSKQLFFRQSHTFSDVKSSDVT